MFLHQNNIDILCLTETWLDCHDVVILGDFNLDFCKKCNSTKVSTIAFHSNTKQLIRDYARGTETTRAIIDLAFVSVLDKG